MALNGKTGRDVVPSSRDSLEGAGWRCQRPGSYKDLIPFEARGRRFSWLNPRTLWQSRRNEWIAPGKAKSLLQLMDIGSVAVMLEFVRHLHDPQADNHGDKADAVQRKSKKIHNQ